MSLYRYCSSSLIIFVVVAFFTYRLTQGKREDAPINVISVCVFIHGTVGSTFNSFNPWACSQDEVDQTTWSARTTHKFRNHEYMGYDLIMGKQGFHVTQPEALEEWQAARYLIPAWDEVAGLARIKKDINVYATFGWSGLLHYAARKDAGYELYHHLCRYREEIKKMYGVDPDFTIIAHSHGGNVALWLAAAEQQHQKKLIIKTVLMLGTPMQKDMAEYIKSSVFESILLCYSEGDYVQTSDYFSSKDGKSYSKMNQIVDLSALKKQQSCLIRHDIRCVVDEKKKRINHTNMWMVGRSIAIAKPYDLLPFMVLTPFVIALSRERSEQVSFDFMLQTEQKDAAVTVNTEFLMYDPKVFHEHLFKWNELMHKQWRNLDDHMRHPVFNRKTAGVLYDVFCGV